MNVGSYTSAAALTALEKWQEITSQNISAGLVPGFKKTNVSFKSIEFDKAMIEAERTGEASQTARMPTPSTKINFSQGAINRTDVETDFAIQGRGFFQVILPSGETAYTRNGSFHIDANNTLVTKEGYPVSGGGGPIVFEPEKQPISINSEGAIMQGDRPVAILNIYDTPKPGNMQRIGDGLFVPMNPDEPVVEVAESRVQNGVLESSNFNQMKEMIDLISISRSYGAVQKVLTTLDENTGKAISSLGNPIA